MDAIRFTDVLTTATAVATHTGAPEVAAVHVVQAIDLLAGSTGPESLAGQHRAAAFPRGRGPAVAPEVRSLVQRWWEDLGSDPMATLAPEHLAALRSEFAALPGPGSEATDEPA